MSNAPRETHDTEAFAHTVRHALRSAAWIVVAGWGALISGLVVSGVSMQNTCTAGPQNLPHIGGILVSLIWGAAGLHFWQAIQNPVRNGRFGVSASTTSAAVRAHEVLSKANRPSLRFPIIVLALTAPLSLQLFYLRPEIYVMAGWLMISSIFTVHVHGFFAYYMWKDVESILEDGNQHRAQQRAWQTSMAVAAWSVIPGGMLFGIPCIITLFTALFITIPLYAAIAHFRDILK